MYSDPSLSELVTSVQTFLNDTAAPALEGHAKFQARVASNVLNIVLRELEQGAIAEAEEVAGLQSLLEANGETNPDVLNAQLSAQISSGKMTHETSGLLTHLKKTAIAQLAIDQPNYSGLKNVEEGSE